VLKNIPATTAIEKADKTRFLKYIVILISIG